MEISVLNINGEQVDTIQLSTQIFDVMVNVGLMHQAYIRQQANARLGTHNSKTRGEVSRSTQKIWRQKGTGRARHGSKRAPIFVGGGVAHGPKPRDYTVKMPRKMRREALRSALSAKFQQGGLVIVDTLELETAKTRQMTSVLEKLVGESSALVLLDKKDENIERATNNIPDAKTLRVTYLNIRDLLSYDKVVMPLAALNVIEEWLG
ncbi:MAG: 50S ribosomal protein L4 [Anaerolineales bacterium]|nr:50S ribosomal protein L4 [Anaerolineales bacterium]